MVGNEGLSGLTRDSKAVNASLGRPENILHALLLKVVGPGAAQCCRKEVSLVQQQHRALGRVQGHRVAL